MLVERVFNQESKRLKNKIIYGPEKCPLALVLPYIGSQYASFERAITRIKEKAYYSVKQLVFLILSNPYTERQIPNNKQKYNSVFYTFQCCCESNYIGQTSRHLIKRIKEHVPKFVENFIQHPVKLKSTAIKNALTRSVISEH